MRELYDYVFKRALAEVDTLINLAPDQDKPDLRMIRSELVILRPGRVSVKPWPPKFKKDAEVEPPQGANSSDSEKVSESFVKVSDEAGLDFTGEWVCENGETAEVWKFEDGLWVGSRNGVGTTTWNRNGYHSESDEWNLKDRIRQGRNYK